MTTTLLTRIINSTLGVCAGKSVKPDMKFAEKYSELLCVFTHSFHVRQRQNGIGPRVNCYFIEANSGDRTRYLEDLRCIYRMNVRAFSSHPKISSQAL